MNRILFFPHEIERFCITEQEQHAYALRLPLCDERAKHIRAVLLQGGTQAPVNDNPTVQLQAGVIETSMGTLRVFTVEEGALSCVYTAENAGAFASTYDITLLLAHPRPPVMARLIRDLSTFGVKRIAVYASALSEKSYLKASLWNNPEGLALQGAMQARGLNTLPRISTHYALKHALTHIEQEHEEDETKPLRKVYFSHEAKKSFYATLVSQPKPEAQRWAFALGAERGLSEREETLLMHGGFVSHMLCNTVLRCETAVTLAVGMCMSAQ